MKSPSQSRRIGRSRRADERDQDPLPEGNWLFRRIYVFILTAGLLAGVAAIIALTPRDHLQPIAGWMLGLIALIVVLYLVAPSAAELGRMIVSLPAWRFGRAPEPPPAAPPPPELEQ